MKKFNYLVSIAIVVTMLSACSGNNNKAETQDGNIQTTMAQELGAPHKYPFEKGIVYQDMSAMGMEMPTIIYVDKWGEWEATEMKMEMMGVKTHTLKITKGEDYWDIDLEKKTGIHRKQHVNTGYYGLDLEKMDMSKLSEEAKKMLEGMRMEITGEEEYLGYKCKKMIIKEKDQKVSMEMLMYGNMPMKMDGQAMGMDTRMAVTKIEKTAPPASIFEVPEGVTIQESK